MALAHWADTSPADWLSQSRTPWEQLVTFGPAGFPAYARLRFLPDPTGAGQAESDVDRPPDAPTDIAQVQQALAALREFTTTPADCFFCIWEGYGDRFVPPGVLSGPLVTIPHRRYALFRGALDDIHGWDRRMGYAGASFPPAFAWPADRSWCLAKDVDPHWAGVGAQAAAVASLIAVPGLDVVPATPGEPVPAYR